MCFGGFRFYVRGRFEGFRFKFLRFQDLRFWAEGTLNPTYTSSARNREWGSYMSHVYQVHVEIVAWPFEQLRHGGSKHRGPNIEILMGSRSVSDPGACKWSNVTMAPWPKQCTAAGAQPAGASTR